jgi:hypothetical protein
LLALVIIGSLPVQGQHPPLPATPGTERDLKLPNGKSQREEIVKEDYKKNLEDAAQLAKLAEEVKGDLEKDDSHVVSVKTLKKLDEVEKLAKAIRGRLKRY